MQVGKYVYTCDLKTLENINLSFAMFITFWSRLTFDPRIKMPMEMVSMIKLEMNIP